MYQVLVALRTNYAPIMVRLLANRDAAELDRVVRRARARTYAGAAVVGAVTVAGYALIVPRVTHDPEVARSGLYFAILIAGMVASAGYAPFSQLLLWAGRPGWHTVMIAIVVIPNAALCVALVVAGGALGASVATAVTYAGSVVLLRVMAARVLGVRI